MTILTIDSVSTVARKELKKLLLNKNGVYAMDMEPRYDDISHIFYCLSKFFETMTNEDDSVYIFPLSLVYLSKTEIYSVVMDLMKNIIPPNTSQLIVLIDGDENEALSEMFDIGDKNLLSLQEIKDIKQYIHEEEVPQKSVLTNHLNKVIRSESLSFIASQICIDKHSILR
ncbi:hypothetical protein PBCV1_A411R [Paramecium bursaria Chlorella virus 1]|uniref:Uncharacterized protein n=1 Tax=Paramecium bursaria Chlorella virus 1 TaxID=10506 RepID=Q98463_PBCV1|nr:hypothetical protein PBCV1_A411R [Paramecium bursaria Chlorella virus 1]AAC96779.1 hypothetical protein [Paramecium bursaria Chlorella virus 1]